MKLYALVLLARLSEITRDTFLLARIELINLCSLIISWLFSKFWASRVIDESCAFRRRRACFFACDYARDRKEQHVLKTTWIIHTCMSKTKQWTFDDEINTSSSLYNQCAFAWLNYSKLWSNFHATLNVSWKFETTTSRTFYVSRSFDIRLRRFLISFVIISWVLCRSTRAR
jgi:hypothetical protein